MTKEAILKQLRDAKSEHTKWVLRAEMLVKGVNLNEDAIELEYIKCKFGKWLYSEAQKLTVIPELKEIIQRIMEYHKELHNAYLEIFEIFFKNKGFFATLFNTPKKITPKEAQKSQENFDKLEEISQKLLAELENLELKIIELKEGELEKMMI